MTKLNPKFNREAERKKRGQFSILVAGRPAAFGHLVSSCNPHSAVQHSTAEFRASLNVNKNIHDLVNYFTYLCSTKKISLLARVHAT